MFRFRLEKVLRYRQRRVELEARALRLRAAAWSAARAQRAQAVAEIAHLAELGQRERSGGSSPAQWRLLADYLGHLRQRLRWLIAREREAAAAHAAQRQRLLAAHRAQEVLLRLRERQLAQWEEEERRRELRRLDELGARRRGDGLQALP